jgi:hypothetical protein
VTNPPHRICSALAVALSLAFAAQGCRETAGPVSAAGQVAPRSITPRVDVAPAGSLAVITLALDLRGDVGKIGSFTGRLLFDPSALSYDADVSPSDGTDRASNPGVGVIRVAGAALNGMDVAHLAAFRFKVVNAAALQQVRLELDEVHEISRADLRALVRHSATQPPSGARP